MSKSITQNRNESESNGKRDEISRSTEELNSIEGDLNLTESTGTIRLLISRSHQVIANKLRAAF